MGTSNKLVPQTSWYQKRISIKNSIKRGDYKKWNSLLKNLKSAIVQLYFSRFSFVSNFCTDFLC